MRDELLAAYRRIEQLEKQVDEALHLARTLGAEATKACEVALALKERLDGIQKLIGRSS